MNHEFKTKIMELVGAVLGIILIQVGVLFWIYTLIQTKASEVKEKKELLASLREESVNFDALSRDYEKIKPLLQSIGIALLTEEDIAKVIEGLEGVASRAGTRMSLALESQTPLPSDVAGVRSIPFSAVLDGGYDTLRRYLLELEKSPIFASIDSVSLSDSQSIFRAGTIKLRGRIYTK